MSRDEERDLTPVERSLVSVRFAVFAALEAGASRQDLLREIAEATGVHLRMQRQAPR